MAGPGVDTRKIGLLDTEYMVTHEREGEEVEEARGVALQLIDSTYMHACAEIPVRS